MEAIYWTNSESFSDLDGSWSPSSSVSHFSDQENFNQQSNYYVQPCPTTTTNQNQEFVDIAGTLAHTYGTYCDRPESQSNSSKSTSQVSQSCLPNQMKKQCHASQNVSKKGKHPVKRVHQRNAANMRERRRMKTINDAFEGLRDRIPLASGDRKLSKVDTLRLAIRYIQHLTDMVDTCGTSPNCNGGNEEATKVIIRYHNTGYTDGYPEGIYPAEQYPLYGHSLSWQSPQKPMSVDNKMAAKVWTPQIPTAQDIEEMQNYVS